MSTFVKRRLSKSANKYRGSASLSSKIRILNTMIELMDQEQKSFVERERIQSEQKKKENSDPNLAQHSLPVGYNNLFSGKEYNGPPKQVRGDYANYLSKGELEAFFEAKDLSALTSANIETIESITSNYQLQVARKKLTEEWRNGVLLAEARLSFWLKSEGSDIHVMLCVLRLKTKKIFLEIGNILKWAGKLFKELPLLIQALLILGVFAMLGITFGEDLILKILSK